MQSYAMCKSLGLLTVAFLGSSFSADSAVITFYNDAAAFAAATNNLGITNFEGLAPNNSFTNYPNSSGGLTTNGVNFQTSGGGKFGGGTVSVSGAGYAANLPLENVMSGAHLVWGPPNQPGNAFLIATLPSGITAVGADLWAEQPFVTTLQVIVTADSMTQTFPVTTANRVANVSSNPTFFGVTSDATISSVQFQLPAGETGLVVDNFRIGQAAVAPVPPSTVPEPGTIALVGAAFLGIALVRRSKRA